MRFNPNFKKINLIHFIVPILAIVIILSYLGNSIKKSFDETIFSVDNVYEHVRELSSPKYNGRLAGGQGNKLALKYIENHFKKLGIEHAGESDSYYQYFESIVPQIDTQPYFRIEDNEGNIIEELTMYEDYKCYSSGYGGPMEFEGDILFVDRYLYNINPELINDKIVVLGGYGVKYRDIEYVIDNGGKGLLYTMMSLVLNLNKDLNTKKSVGSGGKTGRTFLFGNIGMGAYNKLKTYGKHELINEDYLNSSEGLNKEVPKVVGIIPNVKVKFDLEFPILKTANILGKIEGKKSDGGYLIIGAHIDNVGEGTQGNYFPGALSNASGTGMMLELARVIKTQKNLPYKTIIFAGWNAKENGMNGSRYYVKNPLFPLNNTHVINLDRIGGSKKAREIIIQSGEGTSNIFKSKLIQYSQGLGINNVIGIKNPRGSDHQSFIEANVPAISISDSAYNMYTYRDTIDNISKENLKKVGGILTNYIKRDIFRDTLPDYMNKAELISLLLFILGAIFIYLIFSLNKLNPSIKVFNICIEDIYYSSVYNLLLKCYYFITPVFIILFSLIFIANLPQNFNLIFHDGEAYTNLSMYLTFKKSIIYIRNLILNGLGTTNNHIEIIDIIFNSIYKSFKLTLMTISISLVIGIFKGIFDSYRGGRGNLRTVGTLMTLSLPDVFIVLCGMLLNIYIANNEVLNQVADFKQLRGFMIPLLCLSIIPTVYISRVTFIVIQEEIKKEYISAAKAKGVSKFNIFIKHMLQSVVFKVIDSIPTLMTIIISNLIIVEYLFDYKGIVYNLYRFYLNHDVISFIGLSLSLGLLYIIFITISKLISKLLNPMKREGIN